MAVFLLRLARILNIRYIVESSLFYFQFGDDHHYDSVSYMLHMHVKCNWQNGVNQMVPPIPVNLISNLTGPLTKDFKGEV